MTVAVEKNLAIFENEKRFYGWYDFRRARMEEKDMVLFFISEVSDYK